MIRLSTFVNPLENLMTFVPIVTYYELLFVGCFAPVDGGQRCAWMRALAFQ